MRDELVWWKTAVFYQVYPRSYLDTTGNGIGDLQGIKQKIPYLKQTLGIDAIWISPFYPSPMMDFGYDVSDYTDVDPIFGSLEDFDQLLSTAHQVGIRVILDMVPNHSSDQHAWFLESCSSRENPKRDWYVWSDPKPNGSPPNNWLSVFGGSAWELDLTTAQYYLHSFLKEQPDLNWRNPDVQEAMFEIVRFWLERGVDGFRIDVAHYLMKDPALRDNPLNPSGRKSIHKPLGEYDTQQHLYDKGHPDIHQVYRDFRHLLDDYSINQPRMSMGEIHIFEWKEWSSYYGKQLDEIHLPLNFSLLGAGWEADEIRVLVEELEQNLPEGAWPNYVLGNHDDRRILSRYGADQARTAAMLLLTLRGTPIIYYGDEIGMADVDIPPEKRLDPAGIRQSIQARDPNRTPMQWLDAPWAGFSDPETEDLWLPQANNYREINVEKQLENPRSMLSLYQALISIRKTHPVLQSGNYQTIPDAPPGCYLYLRESQQQRILVALNFTAVDCLIESPNVKKGKILLSTYCDRNNSLSGSCNLRPYEGILILL